MLSSWRYDAINIFLFFVSGINVTSYNYLLEEINERISRLINTGMAFKMKY